MDDKKKSSAEITSEEEEGTVCFEEGLFGFETCKKFLPVAVEKDSDAVLTLLSIDNEGLAFIIMNPFLLKEDYHPQVSEKELSSLGEADEQDYSWYVICTAHQPPEESTVNLRCPIVVNTRNRRAKQLILDNTEYTFRHRLGDLAQKETHTC